MFWIFSLNLSLRRDEGFGCGKSLRILLDPMLIVGNEREARKAIVFL